MNNTGFELIALHAHILDNDIDKIAMQSVRAGYGALCVPPYWVKKASRETKNTAVQLFTVVGYPFGYQRTEAKQAEIELALADGADGIGLTLNVSAVKSNRMNWIKAEIARFAKLLHEKEKMLTVLTDWHHFTDTELTRVCQAIYEGGADAAMNHPFTETELTLSEITTFRTLMHQSVELKIYTKSTEPAYHKKIFDAGAGVVCLDKVTGM